MAEQLLFLSYAYPPLAAPESWLAAKAMRGLAEHGVTIDVVRARPRWWHSHDSSLVRWSHELARSVHVVETPSWLPFAQPVPWVRQFPDPMRLLQRRAVRLLESLQPERYDALLTWSQWHSAHLVGLAVKRRHPRLRWVAHLSDPWVDNPLQRRHAVARRVNLRLEGEVMAAADALEFTSTLAMERAISRHPDAGAKSSVAMHTFARELYGDGPPRTGPIVVRCVGSFYGLRNPEPLIRGLARSGFTADRARVELVGEVERRMLEAVDRSGLPDGLVVARGRVGYLESLLAMRDADVLVMVDAPADENVFVASKVVDYVGARRPIVAIVPDGSSADLVRAVGGWVADPRDVDAVAGALEKAVAFAEGARGAGEWGDADAAAQFDAALIAARRAQLLFDGG